MIISPFLENPELKTQICHREPPSVVIMISLERKNTLISFCFTSFISFCFTVITSFAVDAGTLPAREVQEPLTIFQGTSPTNISEQSEYFEDPSGSLSLDEIRSKTFTANPGPVYQFGFSQSTYWLKFKLRNKSTINQNHWYVTWDSGLNDHVDLFLPQAGGKYKLLKGGLKARANEKAYSGLSPLFSLGVLPLDSVQTYYVRLKANEPLIGRLMLMDQDQYINQLPNALALVWFVIGFQLLRMFYNLVLARYVRNTSFRWYSLHTLVVTFSVLGSFGVTAYLIDDSPALAAFLNSFFYLLMPATYTLFIYSLLNVPVYFSKLRFVFIGIILFSIGQVMMYFLIPTMYVLKSNNYLFLFTEAFLISVSLYALLRKYQVNVYLMIPCFLTLIPFIFLNLRALGYINYDWIYPLIYITNILEILALSLVLGKIIQQAERERLNTEKALLTEKLEAEKFLELDRHKTQFFANISHEFRTPLTLLLAPAEELIKKYPSEWLLPVIQRNGQRLLTLINQLLNMTRLEAGQMKVEIRESDLTRFVRSHAAAFTSLAESREISFRITGPEEEVKARFDHDKLEIILNNLLSNAFKFTSREGSVHLDFNYRDDYRRCVVKVSDTGIGISAENVDKIFNRFYQVDASSLRSYEGSGIGLALVKELTGLIKGNIAVQSKEKEGTTFSLSFPIDEITWKEYTSRQQPEVYAPFIPLKEDDNEDHEPVSADGPLLLVVDDNKDIRKYIRSVFSGEFQVLEAVDGQEGLNKAIVHVPDLVICDLMMPVLDGFGFCKLLKANEATSHIPVIMLTAKATVESRIEGFDLGADEYLTKPFNTGEIKARVNNLIRQRELLREKFDLKVISINPGEIKLRASDEVFVEKIKNIIENNLGDNGFDLTRLSDELSMTSEQLRRKLKAITGLKPIEFIRKYRLRKAALMLKQKTGSVSEIAYQVGFESLSYFSKVFQEEYGSLPSEFDKHPG